MAPIQGPSAVLQSQREHLTHVTITKHQTSSQRWYWISCFTSGSLHFLRAFKLERTSLNMQKVRERQLNSAYLVFIHSISSDAHTNCVRGKSVILIFNTRKLELRRVSSSVGDGTVSNPSTPDINSMLCGSQESRGPICGPGNPQASQFWT